MSSNLQFNKTCEFCGKEFTAKTLFTRYCSHACNSRHYKKLKREETIQKVVEEQKQPQAETIPVDTSLSLKEFLSIDEVASLLGASRRTIHRLLASNQIKAAKIGSRTIIKRSELDNLFK
jgi:excisionase family DNA binding protein